MIDSQELLQWLGDALLHITLLLTIVLLARIFFRKASAAWRHMILLSAALSIPLLASLSIILPAWVNPLQLDIPAGLAVTQTDVEIGFVHPIPSVPVDTDSSESNGMNPSSTTPANHLPSFTRALLIPFLLSIWLSGIFLIFLRMILGIRSLTRLRSMPTSDTSVARFIAEECRAMGLHQEPSLIILPENTMPMTWRLRSHRLCLPASFSDWPEDKLRRVLRHELAHIKRNDCLTSWLAATSLSLFWFHPLVWMLRRSIEHSRESACDDLALGIEPDPENRGRYAQALLDVVADHSRRNRHFHQAVAMARKSDSVKFRVQAILDAERDRRTISRKALLLAAPLWLLGLASLGSLAACRSIVIETPPTAIPRLTKNTHLKIDVMVSQLDDGKLLEKLFGADPDVGSYTAVLSHEQLIQVMKRLNRAGHEMESRPVLTYPGKNATYELFNEFVYPTEYTPPEILGKGVPANGIFPVTPATPTAFKTRNVGIKYEIKTSLAEDDQLSLHISIENCRFLGFVNYGSPIMGTATNLFGKPTPVVITENRIEMPVFQVANTLTSVTLPINGAVALIQFAPKQDKSMSNVIGGNKVQKSGHTLYLIQPTLIKDPSKR